MKKALFTTSLLAVLFFASTALATWSFSVTKVARAGHYLYWKVVCTSDGNALTATNLLSTAAPVSIDPQLMGKLQGSSMLIMDVIPGTGGVIPNATINVTWSNSLVIVYTHDAFSKDADTPGNLLSEDYNQFPPILKELNLAINDIGDAGDQVTLAVLCWIEGE